MGQPSIFDYATSELSQDAFICYLLEFGKEEYRNNFFREYEMAHCFLEKCGIAKEEEILEIKKQYLNIDVLVKTAQHFLIIEDKTGTSEHDDQIIRYVKSLKNSAQFPVKVCYLKTMDYVREYKTSDETILPKEDCCSLKRADMLDILKENRSCNIIFESFYNRLNAVDERAKACDGKDMFEWNREKWFAYLSSVLQGRNFNMGWVSNPRGGFYACWFDWYNKGNGEVYKQIEIFFEDSKTVAVKMCFKFSGLGKRITDESKPLIKELQRKAVNMEYTASNRLGKTTTYAFKFATNLEDLNNFINTAS